MIEDRVRVCRYDFNPKLNDGDMILNVTSRSRDMGRAFSPFLLGPVETPYGKAQNMENAWQYSKVYSEHLDMFKEPSESWHAWREEGFSNPQAVRYPMGKFRRPEFSYWKGEKLSYVEARKKIYIPLYSEAVQCYEFSVVRDAVDRRLINFLWLRDFDAYDHVAEGLTLKDVIEDPRRKMGHAFVLWGLLTGELE